MDPRTEELLAGRRKPSVSSKAWKSVRAVDAIVAWIKVRRMLVSVTLGLSFVLFAAAYQVEVARPAEVRAKAELEARSAEQMSAEVQSRSTAMDDCLTKVASDAEQRWNLACRREGKRAGCALSRELTAALQKEESSARNGCLLKNPH